MKKLILFLIVTVTIIACKTKTQGCKDPLALNIDTMAEEQNNALCHYSTVAFYAGSNTIFGQPVSSIELEVNGVVLGTLDQLNLAEPIDCEQEGTLAYEFQSGFSQEWTATYTLVAGGDVTQSETFSPDPSRDCFTINISL